MNEEALPLPPAPPIDDRRMILAVVEAAEGLTSLALAALAANQDLKNTRLGHARVSFDSAVHRLNGLLGNILPPRNGPQIIQPLEPELQRPAAAPRPEPTEPLISSQDALTRLEGSL